MFRSEKEIQPILFEDEKGNSRLIEEIFKEYGIPKPILFEGINRHELIRFRSLLDKIRDKALIITDNKMPAFFGIQVVQTALAQHVPIKNIALCSNSVSQGDSIHLRPEYETMGIRDIFGKELNDIYSLAEWVKRRQEAIMFGI